MSPATCFGATQSLFYESSNATVAIVNLGTTGIVADGERSRRMERNEGPSNGQCFCYICQLIGRSWERLCAGQTWPTMRELKEARSGCFSFSACRAAPRVERAVFLFSK